jgi:hypothetical protein
MTAGGRQLFVYWRLARADLASAVPAVQALQQRLRERHADLQTGLYARHDGDGDGAEATLMETYRCPDGIAAGLQADIESAAAGALGAFLRGRRHVEVFEALRS